jgi:hypothetical protein
MNSAWRNQLILNAPLEHPADSADSLVDNGASEFIGDHLLADRFQHQRAEISHAAHAVQMLQRLQRVFNVILFVGGRGVGPTVVLGNEWKVPNH